ncbi:MAG: histidinol dehydrogenase [Deinococcota bacterium]
MKRLNGFAEALDYIEQRNQIVIQDDEVVSRTREIVSDVRRRGDDALHHYTKTFDGADLDELPVPESALVGAAKQVPQDLQDAINLSITRVRRFYKEQPAGGFLLPGEDGLLGQIVRPLGRVGCYIPGGTAPLFSTLIMTVVPAQVAGVKDIVLATPPRPDGSVAPEILVAARALGIDTVYRMGGAQAIAALAYGTDSVPRVDKIAGPGNAYVVAAKRLVYGSVGIESLPGPTETLVLADESADVVHVAADLLAQAEHVLAEPVLVTTSSTLLGQLDDELERQLANLSTAPAARDALNTRGCVMLVDTLAEAIDLANIFAPEHLCLLTREPWQLVSKVRCAGGIFVGEHSMEALGDYLAGPSHVMPTNATARFSSAVNVRDFQVVIPVVGLNPSALTEIARPAAAMARAEGLHAHAHAIESRLQHESHTKDN